MRMRMSLPELATLLLPFANGTLGLPAAGRALFLRAAPAPELAPLAGRLACVQGFRPGFAALESAGFAVAPEAAGEGYDLALVLLSKHKAAAFGDLADALRRLGPGGVLVAAGRSDAGAQTVLKGLRAACGGAAELSKHHCRVAWLARPATLPPEVEAWRAAAAPRRIAATGAVAAPGVFGWDKIDAGSALLAETLDTRIQGRVADFGAGWGYLSREILGRCPGVTALDLVEAEHAALEAARLNLPPRDGLDLGFLWRDAAAEPLGPYDWVVSNPPFHAGKGGDPEIGRAFIRAARRALRPRGRLLMVANRHLPYEATLTQAFRAVRTVAETPGFKVIEAEL
ncbi:Ribosomal RNA small subunit methyltransferase C [uncultured Alphaproteobacteria bacterium]|uniref:Ribosomal RNA small subunit methyltransferase C n=1 Tax=uncultured Alphaproteobacteria bacterium TaxID=91750 RepID=A0A212J9W2_9PROT|nr:Ribosomal RNA small subunit methyltransferase C [uncultured Alphaproteobacteria bacterium]